MIRIPLSEAEAQRLERAFGSASERTLRDRLNVVHLAHRGHRRQAIADTRGMSTRSVQRWLNAYLERGPDGLELQFDRVRRGGYHSAKPLEPEVLEQQELIRWCEHLVVVTPNWWWSAPALLKGYLDRVFVPEFAMRYHARFPYVEPLLRSRSARGLYTHNAPWLGGWLFRGD